MNEKGKPSAQVVYYSRSGKTRLIAETMAEKMECDILEIVDLKDRAGFLGFIGGIIDVRLRPDTDITPSEFDFGASGLLIVCTPVWGMTFPPAIHTFFTKADLEGKKVVLIANFEGRMRDATFYEYGDRIYQAGGRLIDQYKITAGGKLPGRIRTEAAEIVAENSRDWFKAIT